MLTVEQARSEILAGAQPLAAERVPLGQAHGRVLAEPLLARVTQPPFDTTAMDGYALRAADSGPGRRLQVIGESAAGHRFDGTIRPGQAVRIFTGAPVPPGADTVVEQEAVARDGDALILTGDVPPGRHIRPAGLDFRSGAPVLPAGRRLDARALGLAAAVNCPSLPVVRRPRVAVLATGDELVPPGSLPGPDQIVASSLVAVRSLVGVAGGEAVDLGIAADEPATLRARLQAAIDADADVVITLGGASVGDRDLVRDVFAGFGVSSGFWKIAMRPGKPLVFGRRGDTRVLGLPGNPVSSYVCALLFLVPLIRALTGRPAGPAFRAVPTAAPLARNGEREDYLRAELVGTSGQPAVRAFPVQDSSMQSVLAAADVLIRRPIGAPEAAAGDLVDVLHFED